MQRYLNTPPEDDPVPVAEITAAISQQFQTPDKKRKSDSASDTYSFDPNGGISNYSTSDVFSCGANSDRGFDSRSISGISNESSASNSSQVSHASWAGRQGRKRYKMEQKRAFSEHGFPLVKQQNVTYQCTWCYQGFARSYCWKRHEESLHCPQHEYVCMLHGYTETDRRGETCCVFCGSNDISEDHLERHKARECYQKAEGERSFARPDALVQHIRQKHHTTARNIPPSGTHSWRRPLRSSEARWRCGFCQNFEFTEWNRRCQHVASHFIDGKDMSSWVEQHSSPAAISPIGSTFSQSPSAPRSRFLGFKPKRTWEEAIDHGTVSENNLSNESMVMNVYRTLPTITSFTEDIGAM